MVSACCGCEKRFDYFIWSLEYVKSNSTKLSRPFYWFKTIKSCYWSYRSRDGKSIDKFWLLGFLHYPLRWSWIHNKPWSFQLFKSIVRVWPKVWPQLILHLKLSVELRCPLLCRAFLTFFEKHLRIKEGQDEGSSWKRFSVQCCTKKLRKLLKKYKTKKYMY